MAINSRLGLNGVAHALGLKRRFFGLESNRSLARRVVEKLGEQHPVNALYEGLNKVFAPRVCVREELVEADGFYQGEESYEYVVKEWSYHYSDGTVETVTIRERRA